MILLQINIPGIPKAQPKERGRADGKGTYYRDTKNHDIKNWINTVRSLAMISLRTAKIEPFEKGTPLMLGVSFFVPPLKTVERQFPTGKPDYSNLVYLIENAMRGIAFNDDEDVIGALPGVELYAKSASKCGCIISLMTYEDFLEADSTEIALLAEPLNPF